MKAMKESTISVSGGRILIFIATYNEVDNIGSLLEKIWQIVPEADVLVVDDNSPDNTGRLLDQISQTNSRLNVIHRSSKLGLGTAHHLAMIYAIKNQYDVLITMDADHSHDPSDIPRFINKLADADFVIGSRYMQGGTCNYTGYRKFLSLSANFSAKCLLGIPLTEFTTSYRAFRVNALTKINFTKMHNQGYSFFMESIYRLHQSKLTLAEIPIRFYARNTGDSKIPRFEIIRGIIKLFHLIASRLARREIPSINYSLHDKCANCYSEYLSAYYPSSQENYSPSLQSSTFCCTSMEHAKKPFIAKCLQCGLIQVPTSKHAPNLDSLYENVVDTNYLLNMPAKRKTFARAYKTISPIIPSKGDMLEVGSYCGVFLSEAKKHGWDVMGIEPSSWAANHAKEVFGHYVINGNLESISPSLKKEFDVVVTWDVLEHVQNPLEYLKIINTKLKKDGIIALSTLDIGSWFPRLTGRHWPWIMDMHLFYFDKKVIHDLFRHAKFEMLEVKSYCHYASLRYIYQKLCAIFPGVISRLLLKGSKFIPALTVPVTLGDIKLYVGKKIN